MITLYTGTPGSGKTLNAVRHILNNMRKRWIITNIALNPKSINNHVVVVDLFSINPVELCNQSQKLQKHLGRRLKEGEMILVMDEVQLILGCRDWGNKERKQWLSFLTQHRKYGYDIIFITQWDLMIDKQVRGIVEYERVFRKFTRLGGFGLLMFILTFGSKFFYVERYYGLREKLGATIWRARRREKIAYDTYATLDKDLPAPLSDIELKQINK